LYGTLALSRFIRGGFTQGGEMVDVKIEVCGGWSLTENLVIALDEAAGAVGGTLVRDGVQLSFFVPRGVTPEEVAEVLPEGARLAD